VVVESAFAPESAVADERSPFAPPAEETGGLSRLAREAFAEPEPEPAPTADVEPARSVVQPEASEAPAATPTYAPQWDAARNAYICWEPTRGQWLQHDAATGEWAPIS
jgi:hypothetical protein